MMRKRSAPPEREQMPFELPMPDPFELPKSKEGEVVWLVAELLLAAAEDDKGGKEMQGEDREDLR